MKSRGIIPLSMMMLICLSTTLASVSAQEVEFEVVTEPTPTPPHFNPATELAYDDGSAETAMWMTPEGVVDQGRLAVRFTPDFTPAWLTIARFYISDTGFTSAPLMVHVLDSGFSDIIIPLEYSGVQIGWNDVDLSSYGIVVTGDFYIALEWTVGYTNQLGIDTDGDSGRSWTHHASREPNWQLFSISYGMPGNFLIRAGIEEPQGQAATIESCDSGGEKKDVFELTEDVHVIGSGYTPSTSHDIYLVVGVATWADGMAIPSRVPGTATTVSSDAVGNVPPTLVWGAPLTPGDYDLVVDVNGNGIYDEDIDALDDMDVTLAGLFVVPEFPLGTITGLAMSLAALGALMIRRRF